MFEYIDLDFTMVVKSLAAGEQLGEFVMPFPEDEVARFLGMLDARIC